MRTIRGYVGSWLVQFERRAVQIMSLAALGLALVLVALPPFGRAPSSDAQPTTQARKPAVKTPLVLPRPAPSDTYARAVEALGRRGLAIRSGGGKHRWVALTFDDGPGPYTAELLAILKRMKVPATFFVVGRQIDEFPTVLHITRNAPNVTIGDHTYSHHAMPPLNKAGQTAEILRTATLIQQNGAPAPRLFRPPYGSWNGTTRALTRKRGMAMILWNVDSEDYTRPGADRITHNVVSAVRPGSIVLMHDAGGDRTQTLAALPSIVRRLRKRGYGFVTVEKMIAEDPPYRPDDFGRIGQAPVGAPR